MQTFTPAMTIKTERRKKVRNRPRSLVYVELESANGGMMRDLSEVGFALRAMMPLQAGGKTQFAFSLDGGKRISGEGRIVWVKEDGRVAGIEFCGIPQSSREEIREWLAGADRPAAPEHRPTPSGVSEASTLEELRKEARTTLAQVAVPKVKGVEMAPSREPEIAPTPASEVTPPEEPREEVPTSLPGIALPTVKAPEAAPEVVTERNSVAIPAATLREEQYEEARFTLPHISLASVGSAASTDLAEAPAESVAAPSLETQGELRDVSGETEPVGVLEPLPAESTLEPLPELGAESEFSARVEEPLWKRFTLTRAIGIMVVLTLIASAVVGHRQVGHALIWLGQVIAGDEGTPPPQSSMSGLPTLASPVPESAKRVSLPAAPVSSAAPAPQEDRGGPGVTKPPAANGAMEAPPAQTPLSPAVTRTPSGPAIQSAIQQSRVPLPPSPTGATTDSGQQEYQEAARILKDRMREAETPEAARLLWAAVEKGNVNAEVALAELYRNGQGVTKNCDQARILLSAAAQKGSAEARKQLGDLARGGCE
jgi:hypothetical protein